MIYISRLLPSVLDPSHLLAAKYAPPGHRNGLLSVRPRSARETARQAREAREYVGQFGGPVADKKGAKLRAATYADLHEVFRALDVDGSGYLDEVCARTV